MPLTTSSHPVDLSGKNAIVTGASRGIGAAVSVALAQAGARVVLVGRVKETLEEVARGLPNDPVVVVADLGDPEAPRAIFEQAKDVVGTIDVLVNNAGGGDAAGPANTLTAGQADALWALNLRGPVLLGGLVAADMAANGGGSVVSISSGLSLQGMAGVSLYSAVKGGLEAANRSLAVEWGAAGVRFNVVSPGITRTTLGSWIADDEQVQRKYLEKVPLDRIGEPEDVAAAVLFLSSPASAYVTGQALAVDGGWGTTAPSPFPAA
ncbi:SDR family NAD(P)-dependent oxidoreductase [Lentzea sp. NPDC058450]|uniref:SDR family NAD(P)-dependent oxidoreductase n=1 Tax=Lentzea sp. NPDC058450 TaxID=3346505 RepID=UPI003650F511